MCACTHTHAHIYNETKMLRWPHNFSRFMYLRSLCLLVAGQKLGVRFPAARLSVLSMVLVFLEPKQNENVTPLGYHNYY